MSFRLPSRRCLRLLAAAALLSAFGMAHAETADRSKPMIIEADKPGTVDLQRQVAVFNGNVVIQQGTMVVRADRVEVRELPDGYRTAVAIGSADKPATYRQKRDGTDETLEGSAERIEYDGRSQTLRLIGNGRVRRLVGTELADEITGALITWNQGSELFSVAGGADGPDGSGGRVRAVLGPRTKQQP
jgi:lipopolysaccharide export system protein LptA